MRNIELPYGKTNQSLELPESALYDVIAPPVHSPHLDPLSAVYAALNAPCDGIKLVDFPVPETVAIAINDKTRPVPHYELLTPLIASLNQMGISNEKISFIIATGTHIPMSPTEFSDILPESLLTNGHPVISHDCDNQSDLIYIGNTNAGTPVWVNKFFYGADLRIVIGNLEPHHFMGYSGGAKTAAIGLCGRKTIQHNHAFITHPNARLGCYDENPMRMDVEEIGKMIGVHYAINAILDKEKKIIEVIAGDPLSVMRTGIPISQRVCQVPVRKKYDIVIASCGGYPKDINLYQAQKAQTNASSITKDGGTIILLAQCLEGIGSQGFEDFIQDTHTTDEVIEKFGKSDFEIGPHKAYLFARIAKKMKTILVSDLPDATVKKLLLEPYASINDALLHILSLSTNTPEIAILPFAVATMPLLKEPSRRQ